MDKPRVGRRILGKIMVSLGKRYSKPLGVQPLGEIFTANDAPFPKLPDLYDENGEEIELTESQKTVINNVNEAKAKMTH